MLRNIWAYTRERRAGDVSMPLVSSLDGAAQSNTSHAARDWQPAALSSIQQTHRQPNFSLFYLNGVKHLHKWEASQYMYWQKVLSFFFFKFSCKRKKSWFLSLNRFCTFCEICSESRTEVRMRPRTSPAHLPRNKQQNSQIKPTRVRRAGAHTQRTSVSSRCCQEVQTEADGRNSTEGSISNINAPKAKPDIY